MFVCCKEAQQHSYLATALDKYRAELPQLQPALLRNYLHSKLGRDEAGQADPAAVRLVQSTLAGNGKSLAVRRAAERLQFSLHSAAVHEKEVALSNLVLGWQQSATNPGGKVFHVDLTPAVGLSRNDLMFSVSVLRGIEDFEGNVWTCDLESDVYLFEMTETADHNKKEFGFLLPKTICLSPAESLEKMTTMNIDLRSDVVKLDQSSDLYQLMDEQFFSSPRIQRPTQYLRMYFRGDNLDDFFFLPDDVQQDKRICLGVLLEKRACPIPDASWSELNNFVKFMNKQLKNCEKSVFCNLGEDWTNLQFKNLVVKFLILMSQDFATRSVEISDQSSANQPKIKERREWESSHHPYIFFNEDGATMSFFGIHIDQRTLNLLDEEGKVIEKNFISRQLYDLLKLQNKGDTIPIFPFQKYDSLNEQLKLRIVCRILGVEGDMEGGDGHLVNPDPSYKLTSDNVKKLLAIYMRLKAKIPVVIMGETGCGKTRMIKYLCDLIRGQKHVKNMILTKVHGGLSKDLIKKQVERAIEVARENEENGVNLTVLFFDEANTTSAVSVIKELMVDRINDGNPLPKKSTLQFICAVNPYRKHSEEMIKKLESSGLGYHIDAASTKDLLGKIPLRRLVYRVNALPLSMLPFVWDFGKVNKKDEKEYICQMVKNVGERLPDERKMIDLLCMSQQFMRDCSYECSFVSLRDVERFLKVCSWFVENEKLLFPRMEFLKSEDAPQRGTVLLLLGLGVNYFMRLEKERTRYSTAVCQKLGVPSGLLERTISACQDLFMEELKLDATIAKNDALKVRSGFRHMFLLV